MSDAPHHLDGQFEPAAEAMAKANPYIPTAAVAAASAAISLKRIADTLTGVGLADLFADASGGIGAVMHEAGMAFQNGINRQR